VSNLFSRLLCLTILSGVGIISMPCEASAQTRQARPEPLNVSVDSLPSRQGPATTGSLIGQPFDDALSLNGSSFSVATEDAGQGGSASPSSPAPSGGSTTGYVRPDARKRFKRYVNSTVGPFALIGIAAGAGINQANDSPREWGQGAKGYGKRFASGLGGTAIQKTTVYGLSEALKLDSGFYKSTRQGFGPRTRDALIQAVTSRKSDGSRVASVPLLTGYFVRGMAPLAWYPDRYGFRDGLRGAGFSLASTFGVNLLREFVLHKK
jgi:hypothetical protein